MDPTFTSTYSTHRVGGLYHKMVTQPGSYYRCMYGNYEHFPVTESVKRPQDWKRSYNSGKFIPNTYSQHAYDVGRCRAEVVKLNPSTFKLFLNYPEWCGPVEQTCIVNGSSYEFFSLDKILPEVGVQMSASTFECTLGKKRETYLAEQAVTKAYGNLLKPEYASLAELGEIRETLDFLRSPMFNLVKLLEPKDFLSMKKYKELLAKVRQISNANRSSKTWEWARWARELPDAAVDDWLRLRYAIRPLVISLTDALAALAKKRAAFDPNAILCARSKFVDTSFGRSEYRNIGTFEDYSKAYPLEIGEKVTHTARRETVVRGGVHYKLKMKPSELARWGLDFKYLPETIWELTKFSFMLDWIIDVGAFIESFRFNPEVEILGTFAGLKTRVTVDSAFIAEYQPNMYLGNWNRWIINAKPMKSTMKSVVEFYNRRIGVPRLTHPGLGTGIDLCKSADILAILWRPLTQASKIKL